jgi:hypothetical protein
MGTGVLRENGGHGPSLRTDWGGMVVHSEGKNCCGETSALRTPRRVPAAVGYWRRRLFRPREDRGKSAGELLGHVWIFQRDSHSPSLSGAPPRSRAWTPRCR